MHALESVMRVRSLGAYDELLSMEHEGVSGNLLSALFSMRSAIGGGSLEFAVAWARNRKTPDQLVSRVMFPVEALEGLDVVADRMRSRAQTKGFAVEGYVTRLDRLPGDTVGPGNILVVPSARTTSCAASRFTSTPSPMQTRSVRTKMVGSCGWLERCTRKAGAGRSPTHRDSRSFRRLPKIVMRPRRNLRSAENASFAPTHLPADLHGDLHGADTRQVSEQVAKLIEPQPRDDPKGIAGRAIPWQPRLLPQGIPASRTRDRCHRDDPALTSRQPEPALPLDCHRQGIASSAKGDAVKRVLYGSPRFLRHRHSRPRRHDLSPALSVLYVSMHRDHQDHRDRHRDHADRSIVITQIGIVITEIGIVILIPASHTDP